MLWQLFQGGRLKVITKERNAVQRRATANLMFGACVYLNAGRFSQARSCLQQCLVNSALDALSGFGQSFAHR